MTSYEKYEILLKSTGKTSYRVAIDTGIGKNIFTYWKQGRSKPKMEKLKILADYFDVPLDYFLDD